MSFAPAHVSPWVPDAEDLCVAALFRVSADRVRALAGPVSSHVNALHASSAEYSSRVPNSSLKGLLQGSLSTFVIDVWFQVVASLSNGKFVSPNVLLTRFMPSGIEFNEELCESLSDVLLGTHMVCPLLISAHVPGHFLFSEVDHVRREITICDPLGKDHAVRRRFMAKSINLWLHSERARQNPVVMSCNDYDMSVNPDRLPVQTDGVSCGVLVCAYAYFRGVFGRWPTETDFTGRHHRVLRLVILEACLTGCLGLGDGDDVVLISPVLDKQSRVLHNLRNDLAERVDRMSEAEITNEMMFIESLEHDHGL